MYLLMTDETNLVETPNAKFFAYGGLIIPTSKIDSIRRKIEEIRRKAGYGPTDSLKFDTNSRPKHVTAEQATACKAEVIDCCLVEGCKFIAYVVLHAIAKSNSQSKNVIWGADHVIGKFNFFLTTQKSTGFVVVDRLPDGVQFPWLSEKFSRGLTISDGEHVPLDRIQLFASTCNNASHLSSAMDIVLGSFRYCINQSGAEHVRQSIMKKIANLIWSEREGKDIYAFEKGLIFRPKQVTKPEYQAEYDLLLSQINSLIDG